MHKGEIKHFFRQMKASLYAHIDAWMSSPRTITMGIFLVCIIYMLTRSYQNALQMNGYSAHMGESIFRYLLNGFNMNMTSTVLLIMFSETPRRIGFQNFMLIRMSRAKWLASQLLFCVVVVLLMLILTTAVSTLMTIPYVGNGTGWSDLERFALDQEYEFAPQLCPAYIRALSPFEACVIAGLILFFFWVTMLFIILIFSIFGHPNAGLMLYIFIILSPITILFEAIPGFKTPMHFSTLAAVASQFPEHELDAIPYVLATYAMIDILLIAAMSSRIKKVDLYFLGKE